MVTAKAQRQRAFWRVVAYVVTPVLFFALIPTAGVYWYVDHQAQQRDRKAAENDQRITAIALWDRYDNDIRACTRGNVLRAHVAELDTATKATNTILATFLDTSAAFRKSAGQDKGAAQSLQAREDIKTVAEGIKPIAQIDCLTVIKKPGKPRPK